MIRFQPMCLAAAGALVASALTAQAACYDPNAQRDQMLGDWVAWVPAAGASASRNGQSYGRPAAIALAVADINSRFAAQGSDAAENPAAAAAMAVLQGGGINGAAAQRYAAANLDVAFADAVDCWRSYAQ